MKKKLLVLDIGCGRKKIAGAIGIDFSSMSDADIVIDLNHDYLPYDDNSVDFIYSSHTLEHLTLDGFFHIMKEAYRVLRPGSQFKIVVPYFMSSLNLANPFHNNNVCFNEHTFRFFSSDVDCEAIAPQEYQTPSCPQWGLRYSANSEIAIEFKTLHVEKFYFPKYARLSLEDKIRLSSQKINVVEQISYSLQAIKPLPIKPETGPVASLDDPFEFVEVQLSYLSDQLLYIEKNLISSFDVDRGKVLNKSCYIGDGLYVTNGIFTPVNFLIIELDNVIQALQILIDESIDPKAI